MDSSTRSAPIHSTIFCPDSPPSSDVPIAIFPAIKRRNEPPLPSRSARHCPAIYLPLVSPVVFSGVLSSPQVSAFPPPGTTQTQKPRTLYLCPDLTALQALHPCYTLEHHCSGFSRVVSPLLKSSPPGKPSLHQMGRRRLPPPPLFLSTPPSVSDAPFSDRCLGPCVLPITANPELDVLRVLPPINVLSILGSTIVRYRQRFSSYAFRFIGSQIRNADATCCWTELGHHRKRCPVRTPS